MVSTFVKYSVLALSMSALLTGCGGDSSSNSTAQNSLFGGTAIDGYLSGAKVTLSKSGCEQFSTTTNAQGKFSLEVSAVCEDSPVIISGGTDDVVGAFKGSLYLNKLKSGENIVSPLTTLDYFVKQQNGNIKEVLKNLGFDENLDINSYDPIAASNSKDQAKFVVLQSILSDIQANAESKSSELNLVNIFIQAVIKSENTLFDDSGKVIASTLSEVKQSLQKEANVELNSPLTATLITALENVQLGSSTGNLINLISKDALEEIQQIAKNPEYSTVKFTSFDLKDVVNSTLANPLVINYNQLNTQLNLTLNLDKAAGEIADNKKLAFKLKTNENTYLNFLVNEVNFKFDKNGETTSVIVPKGTEVELETSFNNTMSSSITINKDILISSANTITLQDLISSNSKAQSYYNDFIASVRSGDVLEAEFFISNGGLAIIKNENIASNQSITIGEATVTGSQIKGFFKIN